MQPCTRPHAVRHVSPVVSKKLLGTAFKQPKPLFVIVLPKPDILRVRPFVVAKSIFLVVFKVAQIAVARLIQA
jgi:hypothetical protein